MRSEGRGIDRRRSGSRAPGHRAGIRPVKRLLLPFVALVSACSPQAGGDPVTRIDLENPDAEVAAAPSPSPTPDIDSACETVTFDGSQFTHCTADPADHT